MGIKVYLFITFHPEIDRQSKSANQKIKRHLCTFANYQQDNQLEKLAMAEFATNNNE